MIQTDKSKVIIIGGGFTGLTAAYELAKKGIEVTVLEAASEIGGLAAAFNVNGVQLDRFYHHWFTNDEEVMGLINELGLGDQVVTSPTNTGIYYDGNFYSLSTPWDLLNFRPLNFIDRIRLGIMVLRARHIKNWKKLEGKSAYEWLKELGGENVFRIVWEPLLKGKFGPYAEKISAVWFWNKLKLRGGSRGKGGEERLAYFRGAFISLADALADKIRHFGGHIVLDTPVSCVKKIGGKWKIETQKCIYESQHVIFTTALPQVAEMIESWAEPRYIAELTRIQYIGNVCLVMELDRSLSKTYWLNVNDASFPFVGFIEHTNFEDPETYGGHHIVYLSKYLPHTDPLYSMDKEEFLAFAFPFLKKMFPALDRSWILAHHLWRARWSQPVVEKHYSKLITPENSPAAGMYICSMAQIYPEDRGTNYAVREGKKAALKVFGIINSGSSGD